ncbi:MAG: hypothetical protein IJ166_08730 [Prevotella sp.]|nr:hypothetical protein [Prevotella sp.]MBQ9223793.1 hypothetical protein [Prevotella sp.]
MKTITNKYKPLAILLMLTIGLVGCEKNNEEEKKNDWKKDSKECYLVRIEGEPYLNTGYTPVSIVEWPNDGLIKKGMYGYVRTDQLPTGLSPLDLISLRFNRVRFEEGYLNLTQTMTHFYAYVETCN